MSTERSSRRNLVIASSLTLGWLVLLVLAAGQRDAITDWVKLRGYEAPPAIAGLATDDTMTDPARKLFYINKPQLQTKTTFKSCNTGTEQAAVLGCYLSVQNGIFVLDVTDDRLAGIEQVTAAHEMLHAAYDRLSRSERQKIDAQLLNYYRTGLTDETVKRQIEGYRESEPDALVNEMHSIFATEIPNLPAGLETYYKRYFTDRAKVVRYYQGYEAEFINRETQITAADNQLKSLKTQIDSLEAIVTTQEATVTNRQRQLDSYRQSNQIAAYNAGVSGYNALVDDYNSNVESLKNLVAQYNAIVQSRNQLAEETQQLTNEITTNAAPVSEQ